MKNEVFKDIAKDAVLEYTKRYCKDKLTPLALAVLEKPYSEFDLGNNEKGYLDNTALHSAYVKDENHHSIFVDILIEQMRNADINSLNLIKDICTDDCHDIF